MSRSRPPGPEPRQSFIAFSNKKSITEVFKVALDDIDELRMTPDIDAFNYILGRRWYLYGKAGYFYYKFGDSRTKLDSVRFDLNMDYYFWKSVGVGATYEYIKTSFERNSDAFQGLISNRISSFKAYGVIGF